MMPKVDLTAGLEIMAGYQMHDVGNAARDRGRLRMAEVWA
jgi:hypothetical protein